VLVITLSSLHLSHSTRDVYNIYIHVFYVAQNKICLMPAGKVGRMLCTCSFPPHFVQRDVQSVLRLWRGAEWGHRPGLHYGRHTSTV